MPVAGWWEEFGSSASAETPSVETPSVETPSVEAPSVAARSAVPPAPAPAPGARPVAPADLTVRRTPRRRPRGLLALQLSAAVLGVALAALLVVITVRAGGTPAAAPASGGATPGPASSPAAPSGPVATDDAAALRQLEALRAQGLAEHPPTGQWTAQLAAKSLGTTDPAQVAANGSHTFFAGDILAQSRRIAAGPAGADVFVLRSDDFGKGSVDARGNPYWTTLAAGPFASAQDVRTWCDSVFGDVPAATRGNVCLPRQLLPLR